MRYELRFDNEAADRHAKTGEPCWMVWDTLANKCLALCWKPSDSDLIAHALNLKGSVVFTSDKSRKPFASIAADVRHTR